MPAETQSPPALTPDQLVMVLERLCAGGCCVSRIHEGEQVYMISASSIQDGYDILKGRELA